MKIQNAPENTTALSQRPKLAAKDRAFVRLAAAIVEEHEEVVLAALLAKRSKPVPISSN